MAQLQKQKLLPPDHDDAIVARRNYASSCLERLAEEMDPQAVAIIHAALDPAAPKFPVLIRGENGMWQRHEMPLRCLLTKLIIDPAEMNTPHRVRGCRIRETEAMRIYNLGVAEGSEYYVEDLAKFRAMVIATCGHQPNHNEYMTYVGKAKSRGNLRLTLVGLRHALEARDGPYGRAMRELLMRLHTKMTEERARQEERFQKMSLEWQKVRCQGKTDGFAESKNLLRESMPELSPNNAQGVMANVDREIEKKLTNCPNGMKPRVHLERQTGIPFHQPGTPGEYVAETTGERTIVKKPGKPTAYRRPLLDDLDLPESRKATILRLVTADHIPKVEPALKACITTEPGNEGQPGTTRVRGMKRALMYTNVHDEESGTDMSLDDAMNGILRLMNHGVQPLAARIKRRCLMPKDRVFANHPPVWCQVQPEVAATDEGDVDVGSVAPGGSGSLSSA